MDWPGAFGPQFVTITTFGPQSMGVNLAAISEPAPISVAYPAANRALYVPFTTPVSILVTKLFLFTGATPAGNVDIGVYDETGTRLFSAGSTVKSGVANAVQEFDIVDVLLGPGRFYLAVAQDGLTALTARNPPVNILVVWGLAQQETAFPLPATATLAQVGTGFIPLLGLTARVVV